MVIPTPAGTGTSSPLAIEVESRQSGVSLLNLPDEMIEYIASFFPPVRWRSREVNSLQMLAAASARLQRLILPLYWKVRRILIAPLVSRERTTITR